MMDWTADEDLWTTSRASMFPPSAWAAAPSEVASVLKLAGIRDAVDVLDLPCGPGRHALAFASTGHRVVAVDRTASYLDELRTRAATRAERLGRPLSLEVVKADMREFVRPASFDLIVNLFTSIGLFRDPAENRGVLQNFFDGLRPGGTLIIDVLSREILARIWQPTHARRLEDGRLLVQERRVTDDWTWVEVAWTFVEDGTARTFDLSHRVYGVVDLTAELRSVGFSEVRAFGGFDGRPYDTQADRLVLVARR